MAQTPRGKDLVRVLRGLNVLLESISSQASSQVNRGWGNSSLRPLLVQVSQESIHVVERWKKTPQQLQGDVANAGNESIARISVVLQGMQVYGKLLADNPSCSFCKVTATPQSESSGSFHKATATPQSGSSSHSVNSANHSIKKMSSNDLEFVSDGQRLRRSREQVCHSEPVTDQTPTVGIITEDQLNSIGEKLSQIKTSLFMRDINAMIDVAGATGTVADKTSVLRVGEIGSSKGKLETNKCIERKPLATEKPISTLSENAKARKVPHSRIGRLLTFGGLAVGLGFGTIAEVTRRTLGLGGALGEGAGSLLESSPFLTEANAIRIVETLCRVRGAALKLGQMLSIQDNTMISPQLQKIFERVRQSADFMPSWQLQRILTEEFGVDWQSRFATFDERPFAAASIGQVHLATLPDGRSVAMKVQYPGVAKGIESDIQNLMATLKVARILPEGLFVDSLVKVATRELGWECDYVREVECTKRYRELVKPFPDYYVPEVIDELCTGKLALLDFGACRDYSKSFMDKYLTLIRAASLRNEEEVLRLSRELGFLTGYEAKVMETAHVEAVMVIAEPFHTATPFHFGHQETTRQIHRLIPVMLAHRMTPPPEESYSLHRKLSGVFLLCARLGGAVACRDVFEELWCNYRMGGSWLETNS